MLLLACIEACSKVFSIFLPSTTTHKLSICFLDKKGDEKSVWKQWQSEPEIKLNRSYHKNVFGHNVIGATYLIRTRGRWNLAAPGMIKMAVTDTGWWNFTGQSDTIKYWACSSRGCVAQGIAGADITAGWQQDPAKCVFWQFDFTPVCDMLQQNLMVGVLP